MTIIVSRPLIIFSMCMRGVHPQYSCSALYTIYGEATWFGLVLYRARKLSVLVVN